MLVGTRGRAPPAPPGVRRGRRAALRPLRQSACPAGCISDAVGDSEPVAGLKGRGVTPAFLQNNSFRNPYRAPRAPPSEIRRPLGMGNRSSPQPASQAPSSTPRPPARMWPSAAKPGCSLRARPCGVRPPGAPKWPSCPWDPKPGSWAPRGEKLSLPTLHLPGGRNACVPWKHHTSEEAHLPRWP